MSSILSCSVISIQYRFWIFFRTLQPFCSANLMIIFLLSLVVFVASNTCRVITVVIKGYSINLLRNLDIYSPLISLTATCPPSTLRNCLTSFRAARAHCLKYKTHIQSPRILNTTQHHKHNQIDDVILLPDLQSLFIIRAEELKVPVDLYTLPPVLSNIKLYTHTHTQNTDFILTKWRLKKRNFVFMLHIKLKMFINIFFQRWSLFGAVCCCV